MSREIKFRAWDYTQGRYLKQISSIAYDMAGQFHHVDGVDIVDSDTTLLYDDVDLEQYIGLKDKNGKEIYEGDIVKIYNGRKLESAFLIQFDESNGTYVFGENEDIDPAVFSGFPVWAKYLVIGNIHENPELLNPCDSTELNERSKNETTE